MTSAEISGRAMARNDLAGALAGWDNEGGSVRSETNAQMLPARLGSAMSPAITMIDREPVQLAEAAADALVSRLAGKVGGKPLYKVLPSRLIHGSSCRPLDA